MNIFKKRPLTLILTVMLAVFSFFADLSITLKICLAFIPLGYLGACYIFKDLFFGRKRAVIVLSLAMAVTLFLSALWSFIFFPAKHYEEDVLITGRIYSVDPSSSYSTKLEIKTETIAGERDSHKIVLYVDKSEIPFFDRYDVITFKATLHSFEGGTGGFDSRSYYISRGYSAYAEYISDYMVIRNEPDYVHRFFERTSTLIDNRLKSATNVETGGFLSALIIGRTESLDGNSHLNFTRTGISHILALSGLHVAILALALTKLLSLFGIGKTARIITISLFSLLYMAISGFSPSVTRAGIMVILSGILYILMQSNDATTSLMLSVTLIVIFTPHAVYDLALWLSAFATLGVICYSELVRYNEEPTKRLHIKLWRLLRDAAMISVFAFAATFCISALKFESFSVASIPATIIFSPISEIQIYLSILLLIFGYIPLISEFMILLTDFFKVSVELLSDNKWVCLPLDIIPVKALVVVLSVFFFLFLMVDTSKKRLSVLIILCLLLTVFLCGEASSLLIRYEDELIYGSTDKGDFFIVKDNGDASLIYSGTQNINAAYTLAASISNERILYLDRLILTDYRYSEDDFITKIISSVKTSVIYMPKPHSDDEYTIAEKISEILSLYGTTMRFYVPADELDLGRYNFRLLEGTILDSDEYYTTAVHFDSDEKDFLYVKSLNLDIPNFELKRALYNCEYLILGSGSKDSVDFELVLYDLYDIISSAEVILGDKASEHYTNKGASTHKVNAPINIEDFIRH